MSRILIIEDETSIAELERDYVELSDFEVELEEEGSKGLERALNEDFDLMILDLMLPGMDGFEICKKFREAKNTPIIIISAKKEDIDKIRGLGLGADDYMTKPFELKELRARVLVQLRNRGEGTGQKMSLQHRDLRLDLEKKQLFVSQKPVSLTAREYRIMELFLKYPQKVFSKNELYEYAWEEYYIGEDKTVNVHISNIRRKLKNISDCEYIETVWGLGFRLF